MSPLSETSPEDWIYIAEGGSTIVFSYAGPRNLHFDGTVIRLRKSLILAESNTQTVQESNDPTVDFQEFVIQRVVPLEFLPHLEHVDVERDWLERFVAHHESSRPPKRRQKDQVDLTRTKAVVATDLIGNNGWAIEIKPKWGFLPEPTHLSQHTRHLKTRTCRFCLKKNIADDGFKPSYCPLDLYSKSADRMRIALCALWDDWVESHGTVNNLRIFVSGKVLDPSSASCPATLSREINRDEAGTLPELREKFTSIILPILRKHHVLSTLSRIQRSLDPLDIEGVSRLYSGAPNDDYPRSRLTLPTGSLLADPNLAEWSSFLDVASQNLLVDKNQSLDHAHPDESNKRHYLLAYLLSTTFKDCSLIIRPNGDDPQSAAVTIIDLDAKSLNRLERWEALDRRVLAASMDDDRVCVDG